MKHNIAEIPLHTGKAPRWLFERQKKILFEIGRMIILEFGTEEFLARISDPVWFQILGCVSGFDWHSSGVTTTVTGALKEMFNKNPEYGITIFGGKGKVAVDTPNQILSSKNISENQKFVSISKLKAKVDSICIQDGYQLYHHTIFIDKKNNWSVVQQGMNLKTRFARRYHWYNKVTTSFNKENIIEPHSGISTHKKEDVVLNVVDKGCEKLQNNILEYVNTEKPEEIIAILEKILNETNKNKNFLSLLYENDKNSGKFFNFEDIKTLKLPMRHYITEQDISDKRFVDTKKIYKILCKIKDCFPKHFSELILLEGLGAKTLRSLCLISEVVFGDTASLNDPARFSFAFGGKDGHPYPVDRKNYDTTISVLKSIVDKSKLEDKEKFTIFKRLARIEV
jgi:hypothetical protein